MLRTLLDVYSLLSSKEKQRGLLVLMMMVLMATFEVAGIVSVMPFLAVMANPDVIHENSQLNNLFTTFHFTSQDQFLLALAILGIITLTIATAIRIAGQYSIIHYANMRRHSIARRLLYGYLCRPYEFFLTHGPTELTKTVLSEVDLATEQLIRPALQFIAYGIVAIAVSALLFTFDPALAATITLTIGGFYALTFLLLRKLLSRSGSSRMRMNEQRFKSATEALSGIQELKVLGRESSFFAVFDPASKRFSHLLATSELISRTPKRVVELLGYVAIFGTSIHLIRSTGNLSEVLPIIGAYAIAGYRLLPTLQELYQSATKLRFGRPLLETLQKELAEAAGFTQLQAPTKKYHLRQSLELNRVSYFYPNTEFPVLKHLDICIPARTSAAIIGETGAGKSTLVKLLLGLLKPTSGQVLIDGHELSTDNVREWRRTIGYVPQDLFLVDDTVTKNIALGLPDDQIDHEAVRKAAKRALIDDTIRSKLPAGYETLIGQQGIRLSGGQRQRLALARALYLQPEVLILDEATSALDPTTEAQILTDLTRDQSFTLIAVTHRESMSTLCDLTIRIGPVSDRSNPKPVL
ncbi:MAG: ABC transporter ATP-binding protein [Halochromatium sp.]|nr:ABC transporter ATP-binding protein [Halochromatium sp.]